MAIALVGSQTVAANQNYGTTVSLAFPADVTSGNLLVIGSSSKKYIESAWTSGALTKASGTATIGTVALDISFNSTDRYAAIWSVPVTGSGSLTLQIVDGDADTTNRAFAGEFSGVDITGSRLEDSEGLYDTTGTATNCTTPSATSAGEALYVGVLDRVNGGTTFTIVSPSIKFGDAANTAEAGGNAAYAIYSTGGTRAIEWSVPNRLDSATTAIAVYKASASSSSNGAAAYYHLHQ